MKKNIAILLAAGSYRSFNAALKAQTATFEFEPEAALDGGFSTPSFITFTQSSGNFSGHSSPNEISSASPNLGDDISDYVSSYLVNLPGGDSFASTAQPGIPAGSYTGFFATATWGGGAISALELGLDDPNNDDSVVLAYKSGFIDPGNPLNTPPEQLITYDSSSASLTGTWLPYSAVPDGANTLALLVLGVTSLLGVSRCIQPRPPALWSGSE